MVEHYVNNVLMGTQVLEEQLQKAEKLCTNNNNTNNVTHNCAICDRIANSLIRPAWHLLTGAIECPLQIAAARRAVRAGCYMMSKIISGIE